MNGKTYAYLDLAARPAVGAVLLDPRPALVFRSDGSAVLFANAAGMALLGEVAMGAALERRFAPDSPFARQIARIAKGAPTDGPRLEMVRIGSGVTQTILPAACRRIERSDGASALLVVAAVPTAKESLATRAERLADAIASPRCLAAILTADGRVLGASGGYDDLAAAEAAVVSLIETAAQARTRLVKHAIDVAGVSRPAGVARFEAGEETLFLLIVGPAEVRAVAATMPAPEPTVAVPPVVAAPVVAAPVPPVTAPPAAAAAPQPATLTPSEAAAAVPVERFFWECDADLRVTFVSPELATAVGANGAIAGRRWTDVAERLGLDPTGRLATVLAGHKAWGPQAVAWPIAGIAERLTVDLSAIPIPGPDGGFGGYRGFGTVRLNDRRTDPAPVDLGPLPVETPAPTVEPHPVGGAQAPVTSERPPVAEAASPAAAVEPELPRPERAPELPATAPSAAAAEPARREPQPVTPPAAEEPARRPPSPPLTFSEEDIDDAARKIIEEGRAVPPVPPPEEPPASRPPVVEPEAAAPPSPPVSPSRSNVVRLPGAPVRAFPPERLTGTEQDAFRRIAEALGVRLTEEHEERPRRSEEATRLAAPPAPPVEGATAPDARLLDKLPLGLAIYRDRQVLFANRALLDLLGYDTLEGFAAAGGPEAVFPEGTTTRPAAGGKGQVQARRRDGTSVPVEAWLHTVTWEGPAVMLSLVRRAEARPEPLPDRGFIADLARAGDRVEELEAILDTATDGVVVIDKHGRVDSFNRSAEALFGIEAREVVGKPFTDLLAEESHKAALDYLDGLAANGVASVLNDGREVIGKVPRGGLIPLFMTIGRLSGGQKFCAVLRDITHWKNVEEELVAAKRAAETANTQKSEFLAKISHEIRTPLNAIIGFSEVMMEERFGPVANERYRAYLRDIHVSGGHLMSLINDLLDLSKIEAGKLDLAFESVAVNEIIQECVALMQPQANRERIIIRTSLSAGVPNVVADLRSLRQILLNLLSNAIKYTEAGGQVIVATSLEENGEVVLRIRDTGVGMSEKDLETAMKPFRQVGVMRDRGEGTGLGLPLTKALVEANRATFTITSAPDQGTLVKITFPTTRVLAG